MFWDLCAFLLLIHASGTFFELVRGAQTRIKPSDEPDFSHGQKNQSSEFTHFIFPIKKVAVIGAGPAGLQSAAILREHGFQVRLFDRSPNPGGNWFFSDQLPIAASFPDLPIETAAYTPDIPGMLPRVHIFEDGEEGISNDWRWREHWNPSPVWKYLVSNSPPVISDLPGVDYPPDTEWSIPHRAIQRLVRQYASRHGLNTNDEESQNLTSYSTRVERVRKSQDGRYWDLVLRKYEKLPYSSGRLRAEWWSERFDAVVVATHIFDSPHVPQITNLDKWAHAFPNQVYHSREYRDPERLRGKNVLIVGGSVSAAGIARDISAYVRSYSISAREHESIPPWRFYAFRYAPKNVTWLPEILSFSNLDDRRTQVEGIQDSYITLVNGSIISQFDEIIFATGFRRSHPFLVDFHNSSIVGADDPDVKVAPIITDGTHIRSLHWTGHYISDPTIAFTGVQPWLTMQYQALGFAKVWSEKARLPSEERMWEQYPGPKHDPFIQLYGSLNAEIFNRLWVTWLNNASLEFGGRLVSPIPVQSREPYAYYAEAQIGVRLISSESYLKYENSPRSDWPVYKSDDGIGGWWKMEEW